MMYLKIHETKYGLIAAVADENLMGKKFKFKDSEFFVNPRFYKGELTSKNKIISALSKAYSVNLVGKEAVACGKAIDLISDENILMINKKTPHAQTIVIPQR